MASSFLSYKRLRHEILFDEDFDVREKVIGRLRKSGLTRRFQVRRKLRVKIPSLIKRLLKRKVRVVKVAWKKVYKRLKVSRSHFSDLFAGNYLFMQVTPTPLKYVVDGGTGKSSNYVYKSHDHDGLSSSGYSVPTPRVIY